MTTARLVDGLRLYLVADPDQSPENVVDVVEAALRGGVTAVQLRWKTATDRELFDLAQTLAAVCQARDALFFVNDRVDIALAAGADGIHLGVDDLPLAIVRGLGGARFLIGYSPETDEQAHAAKMFGADYLGVGPVYGTVSKNDAGPAIGLAVFQRRIGIAGIPAVGIGGITSSNAGQVIAAGAVGVAVVSAILRAADPEQAARGLWKATEP